jgi:DNA-binding transcriptional LysR family regulator
VKPGSRRLASLDLNLLLSLDALLQERNVTRAAARLGLSQPAVSAALARLRRHFGDELLTRVGNHYQLTPLASQLAERTAAALAGVERVFSVAREFDPATADREFTLIMSDYATAVLGQAISTALSQQAPAVRLRFEQPTITAIDHAMETLRLVDGLVLPHGFLTDVPHLNLYEDRWVCVVAADNRVIGDELTMAHLGELPWVLTYHRPTAYTPAARQLRLLGIEPRVQIVVDNFFAVPSLVVGSDRIALLQARLASRLTGLLGIRVMACPFDAVPLTEALWWHPMYRADPAHRWLREFLVAAASTLPPAPS